MEHGVVHVGMERFGVEKAVFRRQSGHLKIGFAFIISPIGRLLVCKDTFF